MKESVTKFDLEAAFKALDELEIPVAEKGIAANRVNLKETFNKKLKTDALIEDYYDVNSTEDLNQAAEERKAEVAQAKLARIEKIVDLDAETEEDILPSYEGKVIVQCPQCMTLFYKNPEDVEASEDDDSVVNVGEVCQHCGNESGYTVIGKVAAVEPEAEEEPEATEEESAEIDLDAIEPEESENTEGEDSEAESEAEESTNDVELDLAPLAAEDEQETTEEEPKEETDEEKKEEALDTSNKTVLTEAAEDDNEIIKDEEDEKNSEVTDEIADEADEEVEDIEDVEEEVSEEKAEEITIDDINEEPIEEPIENKDALEILKDKIDFQNEGDIIVIAEKGQLENEEAPKVKIEVSKEEFDTLEKEFHEEATEEPIEETLDNKNLKKTLSEASIDGFKELMSSKEFKTPISEEEVKSYLTDSMDENSRINNTINIDDIEEIDEEAVNLKITEALTNIYENVKNFELLNTTVTPNNSLVLEGFINFKSGNSKKVSYTFTEAKKENNKFIFEGYNNDLDPNGKFYLNCVFSPKDKKLITEKLTYSYHINGTLVEKLN